mgnify:FL=1
MSKMVVAQREVAMNGGACEDGCDGGGSGNDGYNCGSFLS